jgi:hypothetical protein
VQQGHNLTNPAHDARKSIIIGGKAPEELIGQLMSQHDATHA